MFPKAKGAILGAAFLMATSAIGPGFLTATTVFTNSLMASFGFAILVSILLDAGAQLNVWRIIAIKKKKAQEIINDVLPGLGSVIAGLIIFGGLAFNIGNIAGSGLGLSVLLNIDPKLGAALSSVVAIIIFYRKEFGVTIDWFAKALGILMMGLMLFVAIDSNPPVGEIVYRAIIPEKVDWLIVITLVGGTVGGYITFAGGHRLLDAGVTGEKSIKDVSRSAIYAIAIASVMRILLFLAVAGVIYQGFTPSQENPAASVFQQAAGNVGYKIFGVVMWAASITSIVGSTFTSLSFVNQKWVQSDQNRKVFITGFVLISLLVFITLGNPVRLLIAAGAINGFILPIALFAILASAMLKRDASGYKHPSWLTVLGLLVATLTGIMGIYSIIRDWEKFF